MKKLVFGTWSISGDYGYKNEKSAKKILNQCFNSMIYEFDTAPNYGFGFSETLLGDVFKNNSKVLLNTKIGNDHEKIKNFEIKNLEKSFEKSLNNLKRINILFLHNPRDDINYKKVNSFLKYLKNSKLINDFGISLARDYKYKKKDLNLFENYQIDYNLLNFKDYNLQSKSKIYARSPFASGLLIKNLKIKNLRSNDHRKEWLTKTRLKNINKKKSFLLNNISGNLFLNSINFLKNTPKIDKIIFGAKNYQQLKKVLYYSNQNTKTDFTLLKLNINKYDKLNKDSSY